MSTTISAVVLQFLAVLLPFLGIKVGSDELTTTVSTIVIVASGIWVWLERVRRGDVKWFGAKR